MAITGDQRLLKRINRMALVRLVRAQPGLSRADLAAATGLTKSTVSLLVQELLDDGWLREDEVLVTGAIGRRPTPLFLEGRRLTLMGAELGLGEIRLVGMSLDGRLLAQERWAFELQAEPARVMAGLAAQVARFVAAERSMGREPLGLGVGVPGTVSEARRCAGVEDLGWKDVPLNALLESALAAEGLAELAVHLHNDGDVAALGEVEFAPQGAADPLLFVGLGAELGAGIVVGGRLLVGGRGQAGSIGHIQLQSEGASCSCGRRGCAEAYVGLRAIAKELGCSIGQVFERARAADAATSQVLQRAGERLGVLLHNLWITLDPAVVVLGGAACQLGESFLGPARSRFAGLVDAAGQDAPRLIESRFGQQAVSAGAAALVLHKLLRPL